MDDFSLQSNPPDYVNDYSYGIIKVDLYAKKATLVPLPFSNGSAGGALGLEGDTLIASLATKDDGAGLFTFNVETG